MIVMAVKGLTLLLIAALCSSCMGCSITGITVTKAAAAAKPAETSAYTLADVQAHYRNMGPVGFAENTRSTYSCVDARGEIPRLSTPGGDYAELSDAIYVFFEQTGLKPNATSIGYIFRTFMDKVASPSRPFYFHTDEGKLAELFRAVGAAGVKPKPVVFPSVQPTDPKEAQIWYDNLVKPEFQGCGHVRLMLYKYKEYGLTSAYIPEEVIRQFFAYWWPTPETSVQRQKVDFQVKRGPLAGKAVTIVTNEGPVCKGKTPLAKAANLGSTLFVYHQAAVAEFRAKVLAPLMADIAAQTKFWGKPVPFDQAKFIKRSDVLAAEQLTYTVGNLPPADSVAVFKVAYKTTDSPQSNIVVEKAAKGANNTQAKP